MIAKLGVNSIMKWLLLSVWILLFIGGVANYTGSCLHYTVFSFVFLAMLISGLYRQVSYGYLFLVAMLWLGFWLKLTVHLLIDYPFGEPIGFFDRTPVAWDNVLLSASVGSVGVILARFLYHFYKQPSSILAQNSTFAVPSWYVNERCWIWAGLIFLCIFVATINVLFGIQQSGLVSNTILLWPLNAVIYLLLASGFSFCVATLLWWDIALGRKVSKVVYFVLLEAFSSTISILSRGTYIFHVIPQMFALYKNKELVFGWSRKNIILMTIVFVMLFAISNPIVNMMRAYLYSNNTQEITFADSGISLGAFMKFSVDRWIGLEGVMAVSMYPLKGSDLFIEAMTEHGGVGKSTIYQEVCQAHYRFMNMSKFQFASVPGAIAFLYFTGNLWAVAVGMIFLVFVLLLSESLIFRFTGNPLLSALWGGVTANAVAQMGIAPRGLLFYFFELICGVMAIYFVQSEFFSKFLQRFFVFVNLKSQIK
ncbi:hypothetical protein [Methylotenera sp. L2L1]|uniref:hypothetical protein n=1 Tax=Methylotenera sp. L2L1 TaxID=1502770 RepID=UPI0005649D9F|nr:hypothetical protein [Methylotenera sp. L2L1]